MPTGDVVAHVLEGRTAKISVVSAATAWRPCRRRHNMMPDEVVL